MKRGSIWLECDGNKTYGIALNRILVEKKRNYLIELNVINNG